jgi:2-polyprenyl-6-methoxyphenol hydroxylase-like FAD-dependent oxidoreductase
VFEHEVVVAGGGPVGCWLAAELRLAGVDVVVLEKRAERDPHSKALTMLPRSLELFAMRGIVDRWTDDGIPVPSSHFALMNTRLDFSVLETLYPYVLFFPQARTEALLEDHALSLGARVLREHEVTGLAQDDEGVTVTAETPSGQALFRGRYAVGCEGGSSPVRGSAGIDFEGSPSTLRFVMGDVELDEPPEAPTLSLNVDAGAMFLVRVGPDLFRVAPLDLEAMYDTHGGPPTLEELRLSVTRIAGTDYGLRSARWLSHWGNATLQAKRYREGRVFLAGDAAHLFPPLGGQGLNLGLQDATNLAWKLGACLSGQAPEALLDTYHDERHPVGAEIVDDTLAQMSLVVNATREGRALRRRFDAMLGTHPSLNRELALRLAGLATAYTRHEGESPLSGRRLPDLDLEGAAAESTFGLLSSAHFVFLDLSAGATSEWRGSRTDQPAVVTTRLRSGAPKEWADAQAILVRPDGYVAWATDDPSGAQQADAALDDWLARLGQSQPSSEALASVRAE